MPDNFMTSPADATTNAAAIEPILREQISQAQGKNGFHLLPTGSEALAARLAVIQASQQRLDVQYYVLQEDLTGRLIIEEILRAADRGVQVRVLLDDLDFGRAREAVCIMSLHDNIAFRIFNPATTRRQRLLFRVSKWSKTMDRYTKRMHNKALVADGYLGVIGGRNLGDEYFDAGMEFAFSDLDVLVTGTLLEDVQECFECYWNSKPAFDLDKLGYEPVSERDYRVNRMALKRYYDEVAPMKAVGKDKAQDYITAILEGSLPFVWAHADCTIDEPTKVLTPIEKAKSPPMKKLEDLMDKAQEECIAVSPYLIPGDTGMEIFRRTAARGVRIRTMTNSLASTDITAVHAAYSKYRPSLLELGVEMHEMQPIAGKRSRSNLFRRRGTSRSSLHAKVYVIDRRYVMLGSMNLDPRSWLRNTEAVCVIDSPKMAEQVVKMFEDITALSTSCRVRAQEDGALEWLCEENGTEKRYDDEPNPGWLRRILMPVFYHIAPEDQL